MRCPLRWTLAWMGCRLFALSLRPARVTSPELSAWRALVAGPWDSSARAPAGGRGAQGLASQAGVGVHTLPQPCAPFLLLKGHKCTRQAGLCARAQPCGEAAPFLRDLPPPTASDREQGGAPGAAGPRVRASRGLGQAPPPPEIPGSSPDPGVLTVTDHPHPHPVPAQGSSWSPLTFPAFQCPPSR